MQSLEYTLMEKIAKIIREQAMKFGALIKAIGAVIAAIVESLKAAPTVSTAAIPGVTPKPHNPQIHQDRQVFKIL